MSAFPKPATGSWSGARREFGGLDTIVCFAGMLGLGSITGVPLDTWRQTLAVNLDAVFYLLRAGLPAMKARGGGSVVIGGSIAALKGFPNHAAYCASKGALLALVRQAAIDYGPDIRVNVLSPGPGGHTAHLGLGLGVSGPGQGRLGRRTEDPHETPRVSRRHRPRRAVPGVGRIRLDDGHLAHHRRRHHDRGLTHRVLRHAGDGGNARGTTGPAPATRSTAGCRCESHGHDRSNGLS